MTQQYLREHIDYNDKDGVFRWKKKTHNLANNIKIGEPITAKNKDGYIFIMVNKKRYSAHRLAWFYMHGYMPPEHIDHLNHKRDDNRLCNLRLANDAINSKNRGMSPRNTSGFNGVSWHKRDKKWSSRIAVDGKTINLGSFNELGDAISARKEADKKYDYHENHGQCGDITIGLPVEP